VGKRTKGCLPGQPEVGEPLRGCDRENDRKATIINVEEKEVDMFPSIEHNLQETEQVSDSNYCHVQSVYLAKKRGISRQPNTRYTGI